MNWFKNYFFWIFIIFIISSCLKQNKKLQFVYDDRYMNPPHRIKDTINNVLSYSLHERHYVFGYDYNKSIFKDTALQLICDKLNQDSLIVRYDGNFQDMGKYVYFKEGEVLDANFTNTICSFIWVIENPTKIRFRNEPYNHGNYIEFPCTLKKDYEKILTK